MLEQGQAYYCATKREVDLVMSLLEKENYKWPGGDNPRLKWQNAPNVYFVDTNSKFHCAYPPRQCHIERSIDVRQICNKIISELRR